MAHPMQHYGERKKPTKSLYAKCSQCGDVFDAEWTHYRMIGGEVYCDSCEAEYFADSGEDG